MLLVSLSAKQKQSHRYKNKLIVTKGDVHTWNFLPDCISQRNYLDLFIQNNLSNQLATMPRKPRHTSFYAMSRLLKVSLNFSKQLSIETYHYIFRREILVNIFHGLFFYRC